MEVSSHREEFVKPRSSESPNEAREPHNASIIMTSHHRGNLTGAPTEHSTGPYNNTDDFRC
ncbi:hypothetical protein M404DRAFT_1001958 [Pisolithus tinctorius Marx 270]|uniref:Uncharacterized protein n=1 Tax=Pisolithus tinctorius Marx 270 TaxID=870435 RepID=A0A0C3P5Z1_PISTI|nr:hypothetical protein M404DRAFT_1001958 [Pisolithus tinctorius Marx 270]